MKTICIALALLHPAANRPHEHTASAFVVVETRNRRNHRYSDFPKPSSFVPSTTSCTTGRAAARIRTCIRSKPPEEYDDGIGDIANRNNSGGGGGESNGGSNVNSDGEALSADFYKNLRTRRDAADASSLVPPSSSSSSSAPGRNKFGSLFDDTNESYDDRETQPPTPKAKKYTGRPTDGSRVGSSKNYFGGSSTTGGGTANNANANTDVRQQMMRREYDLVSGASGRTALGLQAGVALFMLLFFAYIGLSGGIVSGDAAVNMDFGGGDDIIQFEQIIPVSDTSVWI